MTFTKNHFSESVDGLPIKIAATDNGNGLTYPFKSAFIPQMILT